MKSSKIPFVSKQASAFQQRFVASYFWFGLAIAFLLFFMINGVASRGRQVISDMIGSSADYQVGKQIQVEGVLGGSIGNGLLDFATQDDLYRGVKSRVIDLSKYQGKSILQGRVESVLPDGRYVLDVTRVYQIIDSTKPNVLKKYYSIDLGLYLDTSDDEHYFVDSDSKNNIYIKDLRTFRAAAKISQFWCGTGAAQLDCVAMVRQGELRKNQENNFISLNGMKYYKSTGNNWFTDDKQGRGYLIVATDDKTMYYLSRFVFLLDRPYISGKIYDRLTRLCQDNELTMTYSDSLEIRKANTNRFAILKGKTQAGDQVQCELLLDDSSKQSLNIELVNMLPL